MSVLVIRFCALKLIFKLIAGNECTAYCAPFFELVRRREKIAQNGRLIVVNFHDK